MAEENKPKETKKKIEDLERILNEKIRGKIIVFNPEKSEIAKNLKLDKKAEYIQKSK